LAMDGKVYEKASLLEHFKRFTGDRAKSPMTNDYMDKTLKPAPDRVALFENLIPTGIWDCERAKEWLLKYNKIKADEKHVQSLKTRADKGAALAMAELGHIYNEASHGVEKDVPKAFAWYKKAADLAHPNSCAHVGMAYYAGRGDLPVNHAVGTSYVLAAAMLGSETGCFEVGELYYHGRHGFPEDEAQAKMWYSRMAQCKYPNRDAGEFRRGRAKMRLESIGVGDDDAQ